MVERKLAMRLPANHTIEIRSINLKPGTREEFQRLYIEEALPLLKRWNFDVVAHGPSLHDENSYYVIRRFDSLVHREQMEDAYYASDDWRQGPRERILALIENRFARILSLNWMRRLYRDCVRRVDVPSNSSLKTETGLRQSLAF
jgi:hypothetical protein